MSKNGLYVFLSTINGPAKVFLEPFVKTLTREELHNDIYLFVIHEYIMERDETSVLVFIKDLAELNFLSHKPALLATQTLSVYFFNCDESFCDLVDGFIYLTIGSLSKKAPC